MNMTKDSLEEENTAHCPIKSPKPKRESLVSNRSIRKPDPQQTLISNVRRSRTISSCQELFLPNNNIHGLNTSIPKHITTLDEKYVLHCLELIRNCAIRAAAWDFTSKVHVLPNDMARLAVEFPLVAGNEVTVSSIDDLTIGSLSNSRSMMNILKSPLLQQFGSVDFDGRKNLLVSTDYPRELSSALSHKKEFTVLDRNYVSPQGHKRHFSMSTTNSTFSDESSSSSSSSSSASFQGMLQCTWRNGLPHYVFSVDDKREVFLANLSRVDSSDNKDLDYVYTFSKKGKKQCDSHELEFESIATMRVSTSIAFCPDNNSQASEIQFILSLSSEDSIREPQNSNHYRRKKKSLTRTVANAFKSSHSYKQRSSSRIWGSSAILEDIPWEEPSEDVDLSIDLVGSKSEMGYAPNFELAAIIVKDIFESRKEADLGGWGLKFLKRSQKDDEAEFISRNNGECSTSMEVLIPAGLHGGPKTSGPTSLTERWISGGRCDCGGWDMGCPLTILKPKSSGPTCSAQFDNSGEFKPFDLFIQGSKQDNVPILKMVNIHEGLYSIHFQSTLSTLQSFAIAAAFIHSHSPVLRSTVYRS